VTGVTLANAVGAKTVDGPAIGRALRSLHRIPPAPTFPDIGAHFAPGVVSDWPSLPAELRPLGERFAATLRAAPATDSVFLHGDLVPTNIVLRPAGPRFIDPLGRRGLAAWDLAQLAVAAEGRGRPDLLVALLRGYGSAPPLLPEMLAWMVLFYLDKNLRNPVSPFTMNLQPLAERLAGEGDADRYLARYLARDDGRCTGTAG
jgi:Ser/Thr protein kinase RdoA (MazF antagonist)